LHARSCIHIKQGFFFRPWSCPLYSWTFTFCWAGRSLYGGKGEQSLHIFDSNSTVDMLGRFHRPRILRIPGASRTLFSTSAPTSLSSSVNASANTNNGKWTPQSIRVGLIARKRGMMSIFDEFGIKVPITVLQVRLFVPFRTLFFVRVSFTHH